MLNKKFVYDLIFFTIKLGRLNMRVSKNIIMSNVIKRPKSLISYNWYTAIQALEHWHQ